MDQFVIYDVIDYVSKNLDRLNKLGDMTEGSDAQMYYNRAHDWRDLQDHLESMLEEK